PLAAHLHSGDTHVPSGDHRANAEFERVRLAPVVGAVEFGAVHERADVVHRHCVAGYRGGAGADHEVLRYEGAATTVAARGRVAAAAADEADEERKDRQGTLQQGKILLEQTLIIARRQPLACRSQGKGHSSSSLRPVAGWVRLNRWAWSL